MDLETLGREGDSSDRSWLCRDDSDRDRMLDMQRRMRPFRGRAYAVLTLAIVALGPWLGWSALLFALPATVCFAAADALMTRVKRPEYLMFASWIATVLAVAGAVSVMGPPRVATLSWLAIPVLTLSSRFSMRGVLVGVALTIALLCALAFGLDAHGVLSAPVLIVAPLAQILCVAILCTPLMRSDIEHRSDAIIDQLTGMLNRKALATRAAELVEQSRLRSEPVGIVVADLDHFKSVNDNHGHAVGDAVLKDVAYLLRKQLRAFDLAYRMGGEEFVVLLPGLDFRQTLELADRLREAVSSNVVGDGLSVTMSLGVAASEPGETFDYDAVFAKADAALYRAKRNGRDRVCSAQPEMALALV
jgi:diguanylate cyclase (GGDEF)-like protein